MRANILYLRYRYPDSRVVILSLLSSFLNSLAELNTLTDSCHFSIMKDPEYPVHFRVSIDSKRRPRRQLQYDVR
jgi:hypothetical protein